MDFLKNVSIREKLNRIVMLTTSVALLLAALGFFLYDLLAFRNTETRELSSVADIIGANSTAALQFQDPATGRETLETLSIDPRVVSAALYTLEGKIFVSYNRDRNQKVALPDRPRETGNFFESTRSYDILFSTLPMRTHCAPGFQPHSWKNPRARDEFIKG